MYINELTSVVQCHPYLQNFTITIFKMYLPLYQFTIYYVHAREQNSPENCLWLFDEYFKRKRKEKTFFYAPKFYFTFLRFNLILCRFRYEFNCLVATHRIYLGLISA